MDYPKAITAQIPGIQANCKLKVNSATTLILCVAVLLLTIKSFVAL